MKISGVTFAGGTDRQQASVDAGRDWLPLGPWNDPTLQVAPSDAVPDRPVRLVTLVCRRFVPGLLALLASLRAHAGIPYRVTVVCLEPLTWTQRRAAGRLAAIDWIRREDLGDFGASALATDEPRMRPNFHKPLIWNLGYRETCLYLDADTLCLNSLAGLHTFPSLSVVVNQAAIGTEPDDDRAYKPSGLWPFNAGVMVFRPDAQVYRELRLWARSYVGQQLRYGDQIIHNDYFGLIRPDDVHWLPVEWNASTWIARHWPELWDLSRIRLMHFAHPAKPWLHPPSHEWMRPLWDRWWRYYREAVG